MCDGKMTQIFWLSNTGDLDETVQSNKSLNKYFIDYRSNPDISTIEEIK
jgi:hypothetical protein